MTTINTSGTKVYDVAKKWAVDSKDMVMILMDMGIEVKSHMSTLTPEEVQLVKEKMAPHTQKKPVESIATPGNKTNSSEISQRTQGDRPPRPQGDRPPRAQGDRPPRPQGDRPPRVEGDRPPRPQGDRPPRYEGDRLPRPQGDRPPRYEGDRPPRPQGDRPPRVEGDRPPRPQGDRPPRYEGDRPPRPQGDRPPRPQGDRPPRYEGDRPPRPQGDRPPRPQGDRPPRPQGDRPPRPQSDRSPRPQGYRPKDDKPGEERPTADKKGKKYEDKKRKDDRVGKQEKIERKEKGGGKYIKGRTGKTERKAKAAKLAKIEEIKNLVVLTPEEEEERANSVLVTVPITVKGFAEQIQRSTSELITKLMKMGVMVNVNQNIDEDTVLLLAEELDVKVMIESVEEEAIEIGIEDVDDKPEDLITRPPIVTVMGHVDHGKTSLLDAIRSTNITAKESGGITQHIGASAVHHNNKKIMFLDTPGHEAFTSMRARGAQVTDIAVLVVAADDGVKPQTVEAISHAKAANVPIIVAINKIDKPGADPSRVKQELTEHNILVEEWGGNVISVSVSAKSKVGIEDLLEMILLQAEVLELKANPGRQGQGTVIEARLDKNKGPLLNMIVENGTLHVGDSIIAGNCYGRIRAMSNSKGVSLKKAGPVTAVEILGLTDVPEAGDSVISVKEDKAARIIAGNRQAKLREEIMKRTSHVSLDDLFNQIQKGNLKELNIIVKADVTGSVGAIIQSLDKLSNDQVKVNIVHSGVGTITESDIMLASTANALVIGFNVRPSTLVSATAEREGIDIRTYRIIYEIIDDIEAAMKGLLDPEFREVILGKVEIRNVFKVPNIGNIGGSYVLEGKVERNAEVRLLREGIIIHEGKISSLKRFKDDAKEVAKGFECGVGIEGYNDLKELDIIEVFKMEEIPRD